MTSKLDKSHKVASTTSIIKNDYTLKEDLIAWEKYSQLGTKTLVKLFENLDFDITTVDGDTIWQLIKKRMGLDYVFLVQRQSKNEWLDSGWPESELILISLELERKLDKND